MLTVLAVPSSSVPRREVENGGLGHRRSSHIQAGNEILRGNYTGSLSEGFNPASDRTTSRLDALSISIQPSSYPDFIVMIGSLIGSSGSGGGGSRRECPIVPLLSFSPRGKGGPLLGEH